MPGLLRGMARTAAVVGTAEATRNAVDRRGAEKAAAQQQAAPPPQYVEQAPPAAPPAPSEEDQLAQLERLGNLKAQGILTEEEFAAQKAKILGL